MVRLNYIFAVALSFFIITGCAEKPVLVVQAALGEQAVTAKAGKLFSVQIKSQMSTGYSWKLAELPESFQLVKESVLTDGKNIAGAEDMQEFIFKAGQKGDFVLTFRYAEHWKKKPKFVKTSTVKIRIE